MVLVEEKDGELLLVSQSFIQVGQLLNSIKQQQQLDRSLCGRKDNNASEER